MAILEALSLEVEPPHAQWLLAMVSLVNPKDHREEVNWKA